VLRHRFTRRLALAVLIGVLAALGGWSLFWRVTLEEVCHPVVVESFDFDALMALRARKAAYQRSKARSPTLALSPEEMTFLMSDSRGISIELSASGSELTAKIGYPVTGGCYNLVVAGPVTVLDGVLSVRPQSFSVGGFDISWLMAGWAYDVRAVDLPDPKLADQLRNLRVLEVKQGMLYLRLKDRSLGWRFSDR
jgi:hypothetical protein